MSLSVDQLSAITKGTTTIRMLVKVSAIGGDVIRVALHTRKITFESEVYVAAPFTPSEFESVAGLSVSNATFQTLLSTTLNRLDLKGGKWQGAIVEMMIVDFLNLGIGAIFRQRGRFGQAQLIGREVTLEYRSIMNLLGQEIGWRYGRLCRYKLGVNDGVNSFCPVNIASFTQTGTVGTVTNNQKFIISTSQADDYFYRGKITFTSGLNEGLSMETQNNDGTLLTLFMPMPSDVVAGDTYSIVAGDDKTLATCCNKFDAGIDFGAEPCIPDKDKAYKVPD